VIDAGCAGQRIAGCARDDGHRESLRRVRRRTGDRAQVAARIRERRRDSALSGALFEYPPLHLLDDGRRDLLRGLIPALATGLLLRCRGLGLSQLFELLLRDGRRPSLGRRAWEHVRAARGRLSYVPDPCGGPRVAIGPLVAPHFGVIPCRASGSQPREEARDECRPSEPDHVASGGSARGEPEAPQTHNERYSEHDYESGRSHGKGAMGGEPRCAVPILYLPMA
jgi:hypothetical protein